MFYTLNEDGQLSRDSYIDTVKSFLPLIWELFILSNASLLIGVPLLIVALTGHFALFVECWLPIFCMLLVMLLIIFGLILLFFLPEHLLYKYSPRYKKTIDYAQLFGTLSGLLCSAGRQVAKGGEKELNQLMQLRDRLDNAIQYATHGQRKTSAKKSEPVPHEEIDFHHTPARPDGQQTPRR